MAAQKYHRLVFGRRTAGHEHDPTLLKFEDSGSASIFADQRRPKSIAIKLDRPHEIADHHQCGQFHPRPWKGAPSLVVTIGSVLLPVSRYCGHGLPADICP
jgi:hypothetical protein